jgi:hypothetical protein
VKGKHDPTAHLAVRSQFSKLLHAYVACSNRCRQSVDSPAQADRPPPPPPTGVQDVVDVLQEALILELRVAEQEHCGLRIGPRLHKHLFQVLPPLSHAIVLGHLNGKHLVVCNEGGDARKALAPAAAHAHQQRIAIGLLDDAADAADMLHRIQEHHQVQPALALLEWRVINEAGRGSHK